MINNEFGWCKTDEKTKELEIMKGLYETFEIHITGDKRVIEYFKHYNMPYLEIDMLDKNLNIVKKDYMSAIKFPAKSYEDTKEYAQMLYHSMANHEYLLNLYRLKIESPPLEKYFDRALYIERHWEIDMETWGFQADYMVYPMSKIINKNKYVATDRSYDKNIFKEFASAYPKTELCLLDTNINHDIEWFKLWS